MLEPSELLIVLGSLLLDTPSTTTVYRTVSNILPHPMYTHEFKNDIALLRMQTEVMSNNVISPIPLVLSATEENTLCTVTGWGVLDMVPIFIINLKIF